MADARRTPSTGIGRLGPRAGSRRCSPFRYANAVAIVGLVLLPLVSKGTQFQQGSPELSPGIGIDASPVLVLPPAPQPRSSSALEDLTEELRAGRYDRVLSAIGALSQERRSDPEVVALRAEALVGKGDLRAVDGEVAALVRNPKASSRHVFSVALACLRAGKAPDAARACQRAVLRWGLSPDLLYALGGACEKLGHRERALVYFRASRMAAGASDPLRKAAGEGVIGVCLGSGRYEEGARAVDKTASPSPLGATVLAKARAARGDLPGALALLDAARRRGTSEVIELSRAHLLIASDRPKEALEALRALRARGPGSAANRTALELSEHLCYLGLGQPDRAAAALERAAAGGASFPVLRSTLSAARGDRDGALREMTRAPMPLMEMAARPALKGSLAPPAAGALLGLVNFCLDQGYPRRAGALAAKGLRSWPDNVLLQVALAEARRRSGDAAGAVGAYGRARKAMPESMALRLQLAQALDEAGRRDEALREYTALIQARPDFVLAQLARGSLLERSRRWAEAVSGYEAALNFSPRSVPLLVALGWALCEKGDVAGLSGVLRSLDAVPQASTHGLHLRGWAAHLQGDSAKAVGSLWKAVEAAPGDPELCFHLGTAMQAVGRRAEAERLIGQALLFPELKRRYAKG